MALWLMALGGWRWLRLALWVGWPWLGVAFALPWVGFALALWPLLGVALALPWVGCSCLRVGLSVVGVVVLGVVVVWGVVVSACRCKGALMVVVSAVSGVVSAA